MDGNGELSDLHIALSCKGWGQWYAYVEGTKQKTKRKQLLAWLTQKPISNNDGDGFDLGVGLLAYAVRMGLVNCRLYKTATTEVGI